MMYLSGCGEDYMTSPLSSTAIPVNGRLESFSQKHNAFEKAIETRELSDKKDGDHVFHASQPEAAEKSLNDASNQHRDIYFEHAYILSKLGGTERTNHIFQQTEDSTLAFAWITMTALNGSKAAQGTQYDLWPKVSKYDSEREWAFIEK